MLRHLVRQRLGRLLKGLRRRDKDQTGGFKDHLEHPRPPLYTFVVTRFPVSDLLPQGRGAGGPRPVRPRTHSIRGETAKSIPSKNEENRKWKASMRIAPNLFAQEDECNEESCDKKDKKEEEGEEGSGSGVEEGGEGSAEEEEATTVAAEAEAEEATEGATITGNCILRQLNPRRQYNKGEDPFFGFQRNASGVFPGEYEEKFLSPSYPPSFPYP